MRAFAAITPSTESPPQSSSSLAIPTTPTTPLTTNIKNNNNNSTSVPPASPPSPLSPYSRHYTTITDPYYPKLYPSLHSHLTCRRSTSDSIAVAKNRFLSLLSSPHLPERPTFLICTSSNDNADYRRILTCHGLEYIPSRVLTPTTVWDETCVAFVGDQYDAMMPPSVTFLPEWLVATRDSRFVSVPTLESFNEFVATGGLRNVSDSGNVENESPTTSSHAPSRKQQLQQFPSVSSLNSSDHSGTISSTQQQQPKDNNNNNSSTNKRPSLQPATRVSKDRRGQVEELVLRACPDEIDNIDEMVKQYGGKWDKLVYALRVMAGESPSSSTRSFGSEYTRTPVGSNRSLTVEDDDNVKNKTANNKSDGNGMQFEWITVTKACVIPSCLLPTLFALEWGDDDDDHHESSNSKTTKLKGVSPLNAWFALRDRAEELNISEHLDFLWKWLRAVCWRGTTNNQTSSDGGSAIVMSDNEVFPIGEKEEEEDGLFLMNKRRIMANELLHGGKGKDWGGNNNMKGEEEKELVKDEIKLEEEKIDDNDGFVKIGESPKDDPNITLKLNPTLLPHLKSILKTHVKLVIRKPLQKEESKENSNSNNNNGDNFIVRLSPGSSPLLSNILKTNVKIVVRRRSNNKNEKTLSRALYFNDKVSVAPVTATAAAVTSLEQKEEIAGERAIPPPTPETTDDVITDHDASQNKTLSTNKSPSSSSNTTATDNNDNKNNNNNIININTPITNNDKELTPPPSPPAAQESFHDDRLSTVLEADIEESLDMDDSRRSEVALAAAAAVAAVRAQHDKEGQSSFTPQNSDDDDGDDDDDDNEKDEEEDEDYETVERDDDHDDEDEEDNDNDDIINNATYTTTQDDDSDDVATKYLREQISQREKYKQSVNNVEQALEKGDWEELLNIVGMDPDELESTHTDSSDYEGRAMSSTTDAEVRGILESQGISFMSLLHSESEE